MPYRSNPHMYYPDNLKASPMPPAPPDYRIFRLFRIFRNSVFSGIIGGIWGSGGFPLHWNRLGDSFRRSFSPNSGIWTQFDPFSTISDVFGLSSRSRIHENPAHGAGSMSICPWIQIHEHSFRGLVGCSLGLWRGVGAAAKL